MIISVARSKICETTRIFSENDQIGDQKEHKFKKKLLDNLVLDLMHAILDS
jgi:hypothetical protein